LERAAVLRAVRLVLTLALTAAAALALVVVRAPSAEALPPPCNVPPPPTTITTATTVSAPNITFPGPATVSATVAGAEGHGTVTIAVDGIQVAAAAPNPTVQATLGALNVGPHTVQASYSGLNAEPPPLACGGGTFFTLSSGNGVFTVQPQSVRTTMTVDALSADATQPVKLVAHVGSAPVANAGSVSFLMAGHQQVVPLTAAGTATATFAPMPAGSHTASIDYTGGLSGNYNFGQSHVDLVVPVSAPGSASASASGVPTVTSSASSTGTTGAGSSTGAPTGTIGAPGKHRTQGGEQKELRIRFQDYWAWTTAPDATQMSKLLVTSAPAASRVQVTCAGGRCPQRRWDRRGVTRLDVAGLFRNARLAPGTHVEVTVTRRGFIGFRINYTVRARNVPKANWGCLAAGTSKPIRCPGTARRH